MPRDASYGYDGFRGGIAMKLGCVIMASGEGKRFGSNKMLADIYGEPLIARTIDSVPRGFDVVGCGSIKHSPSAGM